MSWTKDNEGFFYSRFDAPELTDRERNSGVGGAAGRTDKLQSNKVFYHKVGTMQTDDILIYED